MAKPAREQADDTHAKWPHHQDVFLGGIFIIVVIAALRAGSDIFLPLTAAMVLTFVFQPVQRLLLRIRVPAYASAFLIVLLLVGGAASIGSALSGPAAAWTAQFPDSLPALKSKLRVFSKPVEKTQKLMKQAEDITAGTEAKPTPVTMPGSGMFDKAVTAAGSALGSLLTMLLMLFFLLATGDIFVRRTVEILPGFRNKRQAVDIIHEIETDMSRYLMTITSMNILVGTLAGIVMWFHGIRDPMLWGILAFLLNFLPIMGPVMGVLLFLLVGFMEISDFWRALAPAVLYLCIHLTESNLVTPRLLARQFTINPLIVVLGLIFWYWMWGFAGALLSMPLLMIMKIVCSRVDGLKSVGHLLEG